jgi:hypothetical protein
MDRGNRATSSQHPRSEKLIPYPYHRARARARARARLFQLYRSPTGCNL